MFDLSFSELLLIGLAALVFIGPKDLPKVLRAVFAVFKQLQDMVAEVRRSVEDIAADTGIYDVKKEMETIIDQHGNVQKVYDISELLPTQPSNPEAPPPASPPHDAS